jgi:hypothetical protein
LCPPTPRSWPFPMGRSWSPKSNIVDGADTGRRRRWAGRTRA